MLSVESNRHSFVPQDVPRPKHAKLLIEIFTYYNIPGAFVAEGLQDVSQSFGVRQDDDGTEFVWFHLPMKDVALSKDGHSIVDPSNILQSQANFDWIKPGFVLKIENPSAALSQQGQSNNNQNATTLAPRITRVTLLCFGAPSLLYERLIRLRDVTTAEDLKADPYILLDKALEVMFKLMDKVGWTLADVFGNIETVSVACT